MLSHLLSVQGRLGRVEFIKAVAFSVAVLVATGYALHYAARAGGADYRHWYAVAWGAVQILFVYRLYLMMGRRAQDMGRSAAWALAFIGGLAGAYFMQRSHPELAQVLAAGAALIGLGMLALKGSVPANPYWPAAAR